MEMSPSFVPFPDIPSALFFPCIPPSSSLSSSPVHTCTHMHRHTQVHTCTHMHKHVQVHTCTHMHRQTQVHTHAQARTGSHVHTHTHTCPGAQVHIHAETHTHAQARTGSHVHTHTHMPRCTGAHTCRDTHTRTCLCTRPLLLHMSWGLYRPVWVATNGTNFCLRLMFTALILGWPARPSALSSTSLFLLGDKLSCGPGSSASQPFPARGEADPGWPPRSAVGFIQTCCRVKCLRLPLQLSRKGLSERQPGGWPESLMQRVTGK